jgi:hypothetical protein
MGKLSTALSRPEEGREKLNKMDISCRHHGLLVRETLLDAKVRSGVKQHSTRTLNNDGHSSILQRKIMAMTGNTISPHEGGTSE